MEKAGDEDGSDNMSYDSQEDSYSGEDHGFKGVTHREERRVSRKVQDNNKLFAKNKPFSASPSTGARVKKRSPFSD